jgi:cell division protein FtsB
VPRASGSTGLTSRSLVLGLVLVFLVTFLAPPLQQYFEQRAQINAVRAEIAGTRERIDQARTELQRWQDPTYVKAQARARLHYVLPGEQQYIVLDEDGKVLVDEKTQLPVVDFVSGQGTWYGRIISSIEIAANGGTRE